MCVHNGVRLLGLFKVITAEIVTKRSTSPEKNDWKYNGEDCWERTNKYESTSEVLGRGICHATVFKADEMFYLLNHILRIFYSWANAMKTSGPEEQVWLFGATF